ncbi:hypothetical protein, partial [Enterococcus avium]|uniref:hypothetical protein n=1 Tax=Enterococcus avium TaxID=33945 RepID=UPI003D108EFF
IIGNPSLNHRYRKGFYSLFKTLQQNPYDNEEIILYPEDLDHKEMKIVGYKDTFIEEYETLKRAFYDYDTSYILLRYGCLDKAEKRLIELEMIVSVDKFMNE